MKENTKRYVKLSIILYIVILSVALVGTLAWFIYEKSATIKTEDESRIVVGEYLEICFDDHDDNPNNDEWVTDIGVTNVAKFPDVSVTPNGKVWYPVSLNEGDKLLVGDDSQGVYRDVTGTPEGYYIRLDLKIRASKGLNVYLDNESFVRGDMTKTDANVTVDENTEVSFSRDAIAGASRVGFFDENGNATNKVLDTECDLAWVEDQVETALADGPDKPIFTFMHHPRNRYDYRIRIYCSRMERTPRLRRLI